MREKIFMDVKENVKYFFHVTQYRHQAKRPEDYF
jgi:hypothetical protein